MAETSGDGTQERSWVEPEGYFLRRSFEHFPQPSPDPNCLDTASRDSALSPRLPPPSGTTETTSRDRHRKPHTRRPRRSAGEDEGEGGREDREESLELNDDSATSSLRIRCRRCEQLMEFDPGSRFVQCCRCSAINQVLPRGEDGVHAGGEVLGMICARCLTTNLTPSDKLLVRCGVCGTISVVRAKTRADSAQSPE
ncbi:UNVERIFIED_CONTAM: hypothetical protein HHA_299980 [Hammondia hammondi]|eukprot:XP_008888413.1 hypothetical protein HHA_299980 [Hammondia hammondi]